MKIKYEVVQLDSHAHIDVYTSERNDLKVSMGLAGRLVMTVEEWEDYKEAMIARFGAYPESDNSLIFVVVK